MVAERLRPGAMRLSKRRQEGAGTGQRVFGAPLSAVQQRDGVPYLVVVVCEHLLEVALEIEGIFRINGNSRVVNELRSLLEEHTVVDFNSVGDPHAAASALKLYLRELPDGIVDESRTLEFVQAAEECADDTEEMVRRYAELTNSLPPSNRQLLLYLVRFLRRFADRKDVNKMPPINLGICFGPNVFRCGKDIQALKVQGMANKIMSQLVDHCAEIFDDVGGGSGGGRVVQVKECQEAGGRLAAFPGPARQAPDTASSGSSSSSGGGGGGSSGSASNGGGYQQQQPQPKPRGSLQQQQQQQQAVVRLSDEEFGRSASPPSLTESPRTLSTCDAGSAVVMSSSLADTIRSVVSRHLFGSDSPTSEAVAAVAAAADDSDEADGVDQFGQESERTLTPKPDAGDVGEEPRNEEAAEANGQAVPRLDLTQLLSQDSRRSMYDNVGGVDGHQSPPGHAPGHNESHAEKERPNDQQHQQQQQQQQQQSVAQLQRTVHSLQKRLSQFDNRFESQHGRRPTRQERGADPQAADAYKQLLAARRQLKAAKKAASQSAASGDTEAPHAEAAGSETPQSAPASSAKTPVSAVSVEWTPPSTANTIVTDLRSDARDQAEFAPSRRSSRASGNAATAEDKVYGGMQETLSMLLARLDEKRRSAGRPEALEQMDERQVAEEKLALQKALLYYENQHGRPQSKREKDLMKPLYDRYRHVKKLLTDSAQPPAGAGHGYNTISSVNAINIPSGGYDWQQETQPIGARQSRTSSSDFLVTQDLSLLLAAAYCCLLLLLLPPPRTKTSKRLDCKRVSVGKILPVLH